MTHPLAALIAGVKVKPLVWKQAGGNIKEGEGFSAWPDLIHTPITIYRKRDGWWLNVDFKTYPTLDAAKAAAQADYEARILAALEAAPVPDLTDSVTVHANMLRGTIAKPTVDQIIHLYGREAFQPMIDAAVAKALKDACLAVSEHADWPEDEHGRTEQAGLFARVINAICAIAPAAPHVNETPKSKHDAGNVLTVPDLVEAGKVLERTGNTAVDLSDQNLSVEAIAVSKACDTIRALIALATAQAAQIAGLTKERDELREELLDLNKQSISKQANLQRELTAEKAEVERLRGALKDMVAVAEQDGWDKAMTGRQLVIAAARAALEDKA